MRELRYNITRALPAEPGGTDRVIYLFHHCIAEEDERNEFGGWTQSPLSLRGLEQRALVAQYVEQAKLGINKLWSSDLARAVQTAEAIIPLTLSQNCTYTAQARSWGIGSDLSGREKTDIAARNLKNYYVQNPDEVPTGDGAESLHSSKHRWARLIVYAFTQTQPGSPSGIVCHGNNIKNMCQTFGFVRTKVGHGAIVKLTLNDKAVLSMDVIFAPPNGEVGAEDDDIRKKKEALTGMIRSQLIAEVRTADPGAGYNEKEEAIRRELAVIMAQYAEDGNQFDPSGDYLCGTCSQMDRPSSCGTVATDKINPEDTSCRYWVRNVPLVQLEKKFSPAETGLTSRPNWKGFGCKRCKYGSEAKQADSAGRKSWCAFFGCHVLPNACCAKNEGDDDVVVS